MGTVTGKGTITHFSENSNVAKFDNAEKQNKISPYFTEGVQRLFMSDEQKKAIVEDETPPFTGKVTAYDGYEEYIKRRFLKNTPNT